MIEKTPNPHLNKLTTSINQFLIEVVKNNIPSKEPLNILDIGGRKNQVAFENVKSYKVLDIANHHNDKHTIVGDITDPSLSIEEEFNLVFSKNVFEHILNPWDATHNILKLLKEGGVYICCVPFSWRYHAFPYDCYRYTHTGLQYLFERHGKLKKLQSGYYTLPDNEMGRGRGILKSKLDATLDGSIYRNNIQSFYIGIKDSNYIFNKNVLDSNFNFN